MHLTEKTNNRFLSEGTPIILQGQLHGAGFWDKLKTWGKKLLRPVVGLIKDKFVPKLKGKAKDLASEGIARIASKAREKFPNYSNATNLAETIAKSKIDSVVNSVVNKGTNLLDKAAQKYGNGTKLGAGRRKKKAAKAKSTPKKTKAKRKVVKPLDSWAKSL